MEPPCTLCIPFNEVAMVPSKFSWFIFLRNPHFQWNFIIVIFSNISKRILSNLSSFSEAMELFLSQISFFIPAQHSFSMVVGFYKYFFKDFSMMFSITTPFPVEEIFSKISSQNIFKKPGIAEKSYTCVRILIRFLPVQYRKAIHFFYIEIQ